MNAERLTRTVLVRLTPSDRRRLEELARRYGHTMSAIARWLLRQAMGRLPAEEERDDRTNNSRAID